MNCLRFVRKTVSRNKTFTLAVVSLLAVGIGVTTIMFSAVDAVLLRPLPVRSPEQLVRFVQHVPRQGTVSNVPLTVYQAILDRSTSFSSVFGEHLEMSTMTEPSPAERIRVNLSTPNFFEALGVHAELGRTFVDDDARDNTSDPPAVLSYGFWQRQFNGDPKALGKTIRIENHNFVIVGVLPNEFNGLAADSAPDVRLPLRVWPLLAPGWVGHPENVLLELAARLKPSVSIARATTESRTIWAAAFSNLHEEVPNNASYRDHYPLNLDSLANGTSILRDRYAAALKFLIACSALLLLMVCASVSGLLLADAAMRQQEFAVRLAIGATRVRVAIEALAESAVMAALGVTGGVLLAAVLLPWLSHLLPVIHDLQANRLTLSLDIGIDRRVLLFSIALSLASTLVFGVTPAIAGSRTSLDSILRAPHFRRTLRGRQALLFTQVAICTALLVGTTLLLRTFYDLHSLNPGFVSTRVISYTIGIPDLYHPGMPIEAFRNKATSFFDSLQERILETPGVESVGLAARGVMRDRGFGTTVARVGERPLQQDFLAVSVNDVSPSYFETLGIRLLSGRLFRGSSYDQAKPQQVIVNEAFTRRFFPGANPLGKRFGRASPGQVAIPDSEIIGVVNDTKHRSLREPIRPILYEPFQEVEGTVVIYVRTSAEPRLVIQLVRRAIQKLDAPTPIVAIDTLAEEVEASNSSERLTAIIGSIFATLALMLSSAGIYALLDYSVTQRKHEVGIRVALGATPSDVSALIGRQALVVLLGGIIVGILISRVASQLLASLLFGVAPTDGLSYAGAALVMLVITTIASVFPVTRASRIDVAKLLREAR